MPWRIKYYQIRRIFIMDEYKIYPKSGFGHVDFNNLAAIFYDLDLAKDFVSYQISLGADYALYFKGEEIEDF